MFHTKININQIKDDLKGTWWNHINSSNFGFLNNISDLNNHEVSKDDILVHKELKEGERFASVRYHLVREKGTTLVENEEVKDILSTKLIEFVKKNKKLPHACKFVKVFKNGNAQVNYHPTDFDNFALKIVPKEHGIENTESFLSRLESAENPIKPSDTPKAPSESKMKQWKVKSSKDPEKEYTVILHENGTWTCTCPNYTFRKTECRHIKESKTKI